MLSDTPRGHGLVGMQATQNQSYQNQPTNVPFPIPTKMSDHLVGLMECSASLQERVTILMNKLLGPEPPSTGNTPTPAVSSARDALCIIDRNLQAISLQLSRAEEAL